MTALVALILAFVPVAPATIVRGACPEYLPERVSCYIPETYTIYLADPSTQTLWHERGHAYDHQRLTERDRRTLRPLLGFRRSLPWFNPDSAHFDSPGEMFADYYSQCAIQADLWIDVPLPRLRRVCRFIRARPLAWGRRQ